jgi:alkylation response protein AidB-like acyl-CoA dehydrogenase
MRFEFTADQFEMRDAVASAMKDACTGDALREAWVDGPTALWDVVAQLGILGMEAPGSIGGLEMSPPDWVLLLEESGRVGFPGPLVETIAAIPALIQGGQTDLAGRVAAGQALVTVVRAGGLALDADLAEAVLVIDVGGVNLVSSPTLTQRTSVDGARRLFKVEGGGAALDCDGNALLDRAIIAASAQLIGLSRRVLDEAVGYAKERRQFGKPIGTFQAVQHHLADALLAIKFAAPLVYRAALSLATGDASRSAHASMAMLRAAGAADVACRKSLQVHGAIGYTTELDLQLYMKRALGLSRAWGSPAWHRDRAAAHLLGDH